MKRSSVLPLLLLVAWVAGTVLGAEGGPGASAATAVEVTRAHAEFTPVLSGDRTVFLLLVGSDARPGADMLHSLADSIHLVALDPGRARATIVGIPRDSWVEIPGHDMNKVNAALVEGGPPLLVETVENLLHVRIAYVAVTSFWGLPAIVDQVGGLTINVPCATNDSYTRSSFDPGRQPMGGAHVLDFARDRHSYTASDLARSENGGRVLIGALTEFRRQLSDDPGALLIWLAAGLGNVETDVSIPELALLAYTAAQIRPQNVQNVVLPGTPGIEFSRDVIHLSADALSLARDLVRKGVVSPKHLPLSPTKDCRP